MNACEDQSEPLGEGLVDTLAVIEHGAARGFWRGADEVLATKQLAERQARALRDIRRLHLSDDAPMPYCLDCDQPHPCKTLRAISKAGA